MQFNCKFKRLENKTIGHRQGQIRTSFPGKLVKLKMFLKPVKHLYVKQVKKNRLESVFTESVVR